MQNINQKLDLIINFIKTKTKAEFNLDEANAIINTLAELKVKEEKPEVEKPKKK